MTKEDLEKFIIEALGQDFVIEENDLFNPLSEVLEILQYED